MRKLRPYHHNYDKKSYQVEVDYSITDRLDVTFFVYSDKDWVTHKDFGPNPSHNWGLWDYDVVECFFHYRSHPYLEVQLSPLAQAFNLMILRPREVYYTPLSLGASFSCEIEENLWKAKMRIPLDNLVGEGELYGNFYACLGEGKRNYFALSGKFNETADFHQPELFVKL